ncbi:hypothetical protein ISF_00308 [Cordyceps fumosorosea ARSEF 2679]|uniref:Oxidase ustYa n=1 Tax=Cordyceps fumosorosea (strain ARSEF 2679) TaxID=1081104 RepID=A0A168E5P7_CORFA|nr:hypothetical protein ISF_00308 [Cordyceps fumosorosea ARSEF 2679]OAA73407.1 hypothetical protein ISF_00308 [Cordyceps fumosorosea ARSEF 2679]
MESYRDSNSSTARDSALDIPLREKESLLTCTVEQRKPSSRRAVRTILFVLLVAVLAISNVILGAVVLGQLGSRSEPSSTKAHSSHECPHKHAHEHEKQTPIPLGGLPRVDAHPEWLPPEEWRTEVFRLHQIYGEEPVGTAKEAWLSMIPKGKGFIVVRNDTELPNMPGFRRPAREQKACVAVFHQMHCLYITFRAYWNARNAEFDEIPPEHLIHCWDYLRQSAMCAADTSLEWVNEEENLQTSGWGFQHTCKNFDAVFEWTESNRFTELVEID